MINEKPSVKAVYVALTCRRDNCMSLTDSKWAQESVQSLKTYLQAQESIARSCPGPCRQLVCHEGRMYLRTSSRTHQPSGIALAPLELWSLVNIGEPEGAKSCSRSRCHHCSVLPGNSVCITLVETVFGTAGSIWCWRCMGQVFTLQDMLYRECKRCHMHLGEAGPVSDARQKQAYWCHA